MIEQRRHRLSACMGVGNAGKLAAAASRSNRRTIPEDPNEALEVLELARKPRGGLSKGRSARLGPRAPCRRRAGLPGLSELALKLHGQVIGVP
jgi:hypothetical protein